MKCQKPLGYVTFNPLPYFENVNVGKLIRVIKLENINSTLLCPLLLCLCIF